MTRMALAIPIASMGLLALASCGIQTTGRSEGRPSLNASTPATLAQVYYWKARPGMLEQYNRYITEVAEPIDSAAKTQDAFVSVTTFVTGDTLSPWTHMRVFLLRDSAQLRGLSAALNAAGQRLEPDSVKRRMRGEYSATLRDRVGSALLTVLH